MAELESGQSLTSRFTLIRHLGRGGMGEVWLARDESLGARVVTKIIAPEATAEQISLLRQECRNARRLSHPNIVRVFDFHQDPSAVFISMEYVDGGDIAELRGQKPRQILATLLPLIEALEYAHGEGVVHRDLKSSNVLLDGSGRPRLSDFGIAGVLEPEAEDLLLAGGGSRSHASPQQMAGEPASPADDIYGLGALLTELLGESTPLVAPLQALLQSMTAPAPEDRPAGMTEVRQALQEVLDLELEEATVAPQVVRSDIRLAPPPRVAEVRPSEPMAAPSPALQDSGPAARHPYWWATVTAFLALAAVAFGVFVLLPKWVEENESTAVAAAVADQPIAPPVDSQPMEAAFEFASESPSATEESVSAAEVTPIPGPVEPRPEAIPGGPQPKRTQPPATSPSPPRVDRQAVEFASAMSEGLKALDSGEFEAAKRAFERALSLSPESAEAADGLARSELALRLASIRRHQAEARSFEQQERWHDAEREYAAALSLDSTLRFAREGKNRAAARAALDDSLEYHIAHPDRLSTKSVLEDAREALASARAIEPPTQKLHRQIDQLQAVVTIATTPVRVLLVSDDLTNVVVYKVGRLGTFENRTLDLRPGTYTVVGTREGYRDVRRQLEVVAEGENKPLTVRCEEPI